MTARRSGRSYITHTGTPSYACIQENSGLGDPMSESANSFTSPFESGDWGRWTNLERFSWLRSFHRGIEEKREMIAQDFTLDEAKMKRLFDAIELLKAKLTEEMNIMEQSTKYAEAMIALGMDALLKSENALPVVGHAGGGARDGAFFDGGFPSPSGKAVLFRQAPQSSRRLRRPS